MCRTDAESSSGSYAGRIAPPGIPKTTSTPAASSERTRLCAPVIGSGAAATGLPATSAGSPGREPRRAAARSAGLGTAPAVPPPTAAVGSFVVGPEPGVAPLTSSTFFVVSSVPIVPRDEKTPRSWKDSPRGRAPAGVLAGALTDYENDPHTVTLQQSATGCQPPVDRVSAYGQRVPSAGTRRRGQSQTAPWAALPTSLAYLASTPRLCFGAGGDQPVRRRASSSSSTSRSSRAFGDVQPDPVAVADAARSGRRRRPRARRARRTGRSCRRRTGRRSAAARPCRARHP